MPLGGANSTTGGNVADQNNNYHDSSLNSDLLAIMKPVKDRKFNFGSQNSNANNGSKKSKNAPSFMNKKKARTKTPIITHA